MAKYIKSIFTPDKRKSMRYEDELEGETESPPLDERRKLSMSRSGRLKQSYKKRQQLSVDVYGGEDIQQTEKPKSMEYHVHTPVTPTPKQPEFTTRRTKEPASEITEDIDSKTPDEEIDSAFEIIDKS